MARLSQEKIDEIRQSVDIVDVMGSGSINNESP